MKHFLNLLLLFGITTLFSSDVQGQLLFTSFDNSFRSFQRQINLNGTGNTVININGLASAFAAAVLQRRTATCNLWPNICRSQSD